MYPKLFVRPGAANLNVTDINQEQDAIAKGFTEQSFGAPGTFPNPAFPNPANPAAPGYLAPGSGQPFTGQVDPRTGQVVGGVGPYPGPYPTPGAINPATGTPYPTSYPFVAGLRQGAYGPAPVEAHRTDPIDPRTGSRVIHPDAPAPAVSHPYTGDVAGYPQTFSNNVGATRIVSNQFEADTAIAEGFVHPGGSTGPWPARGTVPNPYTGGPFPSGVLGDPSYQGRLRLREPAIAGGKRFSKAGTTDITVHNSTDEAAAIQGGYVYAGGAF